MKMASTTRPFVPLLVALALFGAEANADLMSVDYVPGSSDGWMAYDTLGDLGEAHFGGGHPRSTASSPDVGSFLVRNVPEPSPLLLFLASAVAAGAVGIRRRPPAALPSP